MSFSKSHQEILNFTKLFTKMSVLSLCGKINGVNFLFALFSTMIVYYFLTLSLKGLVRFLLQ